MADGARDPLVGRRIGAGQRFGVLRLIGRGGSGSIYMAWDDVEHQAVALKVLHADHGQRPQVQARFERERELLSHLDHPNLVRVFGWDSYEDRRMLVMEHVAGKNLYQLLQRDGAMAPRKALLVCRDAAAGIAAAHALGFIHRDLKPENIMVREADGVVKVLDFGIAKDLHADLELTRLGTYIGTPAYSAPEQIRGEKVDGRADVFSLGVILYELLTGKVAFEGRHSTEVLQATLREEPVPVEEVNAAVTLPVARLIQRMIEKNPEHRFAGMEAVRQEIDRTLPKVRAELSDEETTSVRAGLSRRFRPPA
jgi:serine/threonine protein kinase